MRPEWILAKLDLIDSEEAKTYGVEFERQLDSASISAYKFSGSSYSHRQVVDAKDHVLEAYQRVDVERKKC